MCRYVFWSCDPLLYNDVIGSCEVAPQQPELLSAFGGVCVSVAPVVLNECPEKCVEDDVINCCIPLYDSRIADYECTFQPGISIALKYADVTDCQCSPC